MKEHSGTWLASARTAGLASAAILALGLVLTSNAAATTIGIPIRGMFEDGGVFAGSFTYRSDALDREPSPILDVFALKNWDVTAVLGTGERAFDPLLPGELGIGSFLGQSDPGQPGPTEFVLVESANLTPQPMTVVLMAIGMAGLGIVRRCVGR